jgi:hypothetical protein
VYVLQRCTHPRFKLCEIINIHAAKSDMACVSPASFQRFARLRVSGQARLGGHVPAASNAGASAVVLGGKRNPVMWFGAEITFSVHEPSPGSA